MKKTLTAFFALALLAGCNDMARQPKHKPLDPSSFFADGRSARVPPADTVPYGQAHTDSLLYTGKVNGKPSVQLPFPVTPELLARGQERFNIFCSVCHGRTGQGDGMIVQRGFPK